MTNKFNFAGEWPADVNRSTIRVVLNEAANYKEVSLPEGEITIKLVDDAGITALNKQYTGNDYATDVLAFSYHPVAYPAAEAELGDIAISLLAARRQAKAAGTDITTEVALLALHGTLHIAGLNHDTESGRAQMNHIQATILGLHKLTYREFGWQKDM